MNYMVREFNSKMPGTRVDEMTAIRIMTYDAAVPTLAYIYSTDYFSQTGQRIVTPEHIKALRAFNIEKTCTSDLRVFMKAHGLQVVHSFSDTFTGANLVQVRVRYSDCR